MEVEAVDGLGAEASDGGVRLGGVQVSTAPVTVVQLGEVQMLAVGHRTIRDTDGEEIDIGGVLNSVLDIVEPSTTAGTSGGREHTDTDVGELALLKVGRAGDSNLGTGPVGSIGIVCELETTLDWDGIAGDRSENVDTALLANLDRVADGVQIHGNETIGCRGGQGSTDNAGGENSSVDKDLSEHFE